MICTGGNKLLIIDGKETSKPICGKKPPMIEKLNDKNVKINDIFKINFNSICCITRITSKKN